MIENEAVALSSLGRVTHGRESYHGGQDCTELAAKPRGCYRIFVKPRMASKRSLGIHTSTPHLSCSAAQGKIRVISTKGQPDEDMIDTNQPRGMEPCLWGVFGGGNLSSPSTPRSDTSICATPLPSTSFRVITSLLACQISERHQYAKAWLKMSAGRYLLTVWNYVGRLIYPGRFANETVRDGGTLLGTQNIH